jgi:hypothetical protein
MFGTYAYSLRTAASAALVILSIFFLVACGPSEVQFAVKHLRDKAGVQISETISHDQEAGLDNSTGSAPLQVQIQFERNYRHQIIQRLESSELSGKRVEDKIVELYKLPANDPQGTVQKALCPISVVIPAGQKASITVEWTERWAEGVINEGTQGEGNRLGSFEVFLGYNEPCSLVNQENVN